MAIGTAVLAGALIVGDSIRGSLKRMTLERLGKIDYALVAPNFVREELAADLASHGEFKKDFSAAVPGILVPGSIENADTAAFARGVNIVGVNEKFWEFESTGLKPPELTGRTVALNEKLAHEIGVKQGDPILLRFDRPDPIPAEAVGGRRSERIETIRLEVGPFLPHGAFVRWRYDVKNPQIGYDEAAQDWRYNGDLVVKRWSKFHRADKPCKNANRRSRYTYSDEALDDLPFPISDIGGNRNRLCDYCFFGGPASTIAKL